MTIKRMVQSTTTVRAMRRTVPVTRPAWRRAYGCPMIPAPLRPVSRLPLLSFLLLYLSHDAVRHIHESAPHPTPGPRALQVAFRVEHILSYGDARRFNPRQEGQSLHSFPPIMSMRAHVIISLELNPVCTAVRRRRGDILKANAVRGPWCAIWARLCERRLPFLAKAWARARRSWRGRGSARGRGRGREVQRAGSALGLGVRVAV
jgi:hypothetical protein